MTLHEYISDMDRRRALADEVGANHEYLWQVATGWRGRRASRILATSIERATDGVVTRYDLRPDLFGEK